MSRATMSSSKPSSLGNAVMSKGRDWSISASDADTVGPTPLYRLFGPERGDGLTRRPLIAADQPPAPPQVQRALATIDRHVHKRINHARLPEAA